MQSVERFAASIVLTDCARAEESGAYTVESRVRAFMFLLAATVTAVWLRAPGTGISLIARLDADGVVGRKGNR